MKESQVEDRVLSSKIFGIKTNPPGMKNLFPTKNVDFYNIPGERYLT